MTEQDSSEIQVNNETKSKTKANYFSELASIDVSDYVDKKNGYTYLSWPHAQSLLKKLHPTAKIITKRFPDPDLGGVLVPYMRTSLGYFVEVEVIIDGVSVSEPFPVLDYRNKPLAKPTTFDINNSIQRAKVKSIAGHGLGLYIYAGEDLPMDDNKQENQPSLQNQQYQQQSFQQAPQPQIITSEQQQHIKELALQIANLNVGVGGTTDQIHEQLRQIYNRYKITANLPVDLAHVKINEMQQELNHILSSRMNNQPQIQPQDQQVAPAPLFAEPA